MPATTVYTVGHSTRSLDEFLRLLAAHGVRRIVDVRSVPASRRYPHFAREALAESLPAAGVDYRWMKELGGRRRPRTDSPNGAWQNDSFRGFADYMQTPEFAAAVDELLDLAQGGDLAIMCAESMPWRCHRWLIGDALTVRGIEVLDILAEQSARPHRLTTFARVAGERITYPPAEGDG